MVKFNENFTGQETGFKTIIGLCKVIVTAAEIAFGKGDGNNSKSLKLSMTITEGEFKNSNVQQFVCFTNKDKSANDGGRENINKISKQIGLKNSSKLDDTDMLVGKNLILLFGKQKNSDYTEVKDWSPKKPVVDSRPVQEVLQEDEIPF